MANALAKKKIELSYLDGENTKKYTMQMDEDEYRDFNRHMLRNHGRVDVVGIALKKLTENITCKESHKTKINEILERTYIINFKLLEA